MEVDLDFNDITKDLGANKASLETPELKERLNKLDITPDYAPGPKLHALVVSDVKNWGAFISAKGLKGQ